jgi:predicted Zn-dependent protease with MMP-like domain
LTPGVPVAKVLHVKDRLGKVLDRFDALVDEHPEQALAYIESVPADLARRSAVRAARADALALVKGPRAALPLLQELVAEDPSDANHRHALALVWEDLGDEGAMIREYLEVLRLDTAADQTDTDELETSCDFVVDVAEQTLASLPPAFRDKLGDVAVLTELRPARDLVEEAFDPRALGLFEGPDAGDLGGTSVAAAPTRIVLYVGNLLLATADDDELEDEVRTTVLHEVGHFLGLDETELDEIGLA